MKDWSKWIFCGELAYLDLFMSHWDDGAVGAVGENGRLE
jgi:hypothetical protein